MQREETTGDCPRYPYMEDIPRHGAEGFTPELFRLAASFRLQPPALLNIAAVWPNCQFFLPNYSENPF
jgi:hypothetical protein